MKIQTSIILLISLSSAAIAQEKSEGGPKRKKGRADHARATDFFKQLDLDSDAKVSREEFAKGKRASQLPAEARLKIFDRLDKNNDGFIISEEDMKIRGFGDILGFKQSGIKNFKLADPIHNNDLFLLAEKEMRRIEKSNEDISRYKPLVKLYDRADIINDLA